MGTFSAPMPASLPQRLLLLLSGAASAGAHALALPPAHGLQQPDACAIAGRPCQAASCSGGHACLASVPGPSAQLPTRRRLMLLAAAAPCSIAPCSVPPAMSGMQQATCAAAASSTEGSRCGHQVRAGLAAGAPAIWKFLRVQGTSR